MTATLLRGYVRLTLCLMAGGYLLHAPLTQRLSAAPALLIAAVALCLAWYTWGEATLPRRPLGEGHGELAQAVQQMADLAEVPLRTVSVVEAQPGELQPPEIISQSGEILFGTGDLDGHLLSFHLAQAARQFAVAGAEPRWTTRGLIATGAGLGTLLAVHQLADPQVGGAVAVLGTLGLLFGAAALNVRHLEARQQAIDHRAREILGAMRDRHPAAFLDTSPPELPDSRRAVPRRDHPPAPSAAPDPSAE